QVGSLGNVFVRSFYLANPPTGTNTLTVTYTGSCPNRLALLINYSGVDQASPIRPNSYTSFSGSSSSGNTSLTITSHVGDRTFSFIGDRGGVSMSTNQPVRNHDVSWGGVLRGADEGGGAANVTHTWSTSDGSSSVAMRGGSLAARGAGAPDPPLLGRHLEPVV